ncbi:type II toxin-antitoxin system Phd/YefM family antitoxin [Arthrobacter sp. H14]|uniref:type II toxin-antitoxin system Phd/YefM family antitoxin n=1 Tax=Arthrobacter sp. H14 TaxID=1312959 RepID=UPI00047DD051|nr:type II toxin-antitoxin system Phd/YefM family antitoxin [Arthrobacter sp. H14]
MKEWQTQEAKAKFSEVIACALTDGPQSITRHGRDLAVVLSREDYDRLRSSKGSMVDYLLSADVDVELDLARDSDHGRDIAL